MGIPYGLFHIDTIVIRLWPDIYKNNQDKIYDADLICRAKAHNI